jgi:hypothetical protein
MYVIYSKMNGEPPDPVTVRLEWLPDGTITPLMYWMPDGSCFEVMHVFDYTPLSFLKDRGEGIRFKVRAELTETPDHDDELLRAKHETYLYLTDNWFCGKNFIDNRYGHKGKEFISVTLDVFPNCDYELVYFHVQEKRYMVEKTLAVEPRGNFNAGGLGIWHKVEARLVNADDDEDPDPDKSERRMAAVYFEVNKWFVVKAA